MLVRTPYPPPSPRDKGAARGFATRDSPILLTGPPRGAENVLQQGPGVRTRGKGR
jgi:hypothetical protein